MKALVLESIGELPTFKTFDFASSNSSDSNYKLLSAALNHRDVWICKGMYANIKTPIILGSDGVVEKEGKQYIINPASKWGRNQDFHSSELEILGLPRHGCFAEYVYVNPDRLVIKPNHLSHIEAAALPLAGLTAYRAVFIKGNVTKGQKVLISGIGGGVATMAMQFAITAGAKVYVSSSSDEKIKKAINLGAKGGVNYNNSKWNKELMKLSNGIDLIIDSAAGEGVSHFLKLANPGGKIVLYGGTRGVINNINPQILFWKQLSIIGTTMGTNKDFKEMIEYVNTNKIVPIIDKVFSLSNGKEAFKRMEKGKQFGKIVLEINNK